MLPGMRVSGKFGVLIANPNAKPGKESRRVRTNATGTIVKAVDQITWQIRRDQDGKLVKAKTKGLQKINNLVGVPVNKIKDNISFEYYECLSMITLFKSNIY